jgi:hypothetical protein
VKLVDEIRDRLAEFWIADLYESKVRSQRTRAYHLDIPVQENRPEILHTLLGIELKVGKRRFACPDLATARYMRVFARIGCTDFAVPYDITRISVIADELETYWQKMVLIIEREALDAAVKGRVRSALIRDLREKIAGIGPGETMPAFDRETRQRY